MIPIQTLKTLLNLSKAIRYQARTPSIYASYNMWQSIMGSASASTGLGNVPLRYAHYDSRDTFAYYTPFGGWTKPNIKQYIGDTTMCGAGVDLSFW
jgi:hypothetical protein